MGFEVLWLSSSQIDSLSITMSEIMDRVEEGFAAIGRGEGEMPAKIGVHPREDCFIHAMPCHVAGDIDACGVKCVSGYPLNQKKGLPYITGVFVLMDPETGIPISCMDAAWITAWRTGAASGVYARHFGNPDTSTVSVIGLGVQGRVNLIALGEVFKNLKEVRVFDPFPEQVGRFVADMGKLLPGAKFVACDTVEECVTGAEAVVTCSPIVEKPSRFVKREWLQNDTLCISVDYDSAFDAACMTGNFVCDNFGQYTWTQEQGTYFQDGYPGQSDIYADMGQVCAGLKQGMRTGQRGAVLMGIASHDIMTGKLIYDRAMERGLGTVVEL